MHAWENWIHCTGSTYGTWIRGDPRGWRARDHREHVNGDYRSPPPAGAYDVLHAHSRRLMKRPAVVLSPMEWALACRVMAETLLHHPVDLVDLCVDRAHWHVLARFTRLCESPGIDIPLRPGIEIPGLGFDALKREARRLMGMAKKASARALSDAGLVARGGVWATRCGVRPIHSRNHRQTVARYIREHAEHGAAVWSLLREQET